MVCCFVLCAGHGVCSSLLSLILSITFSFHAFGLASPKWYCDYDTEGCHMDGLFYSCDSDSNCDNKVTDAGILTAVLIVLCSSLLLVMAFCFIVHCTSFKHRALSPTMTVTIGGWYILQEIVTTIIFIIIRVKYDKIGWSAYVFTVPGIILMGVIILMLIYQLCWPEKTVYPD